MKNALEEYLDREISVYTHGSDCYSAGILRQVTDSVLVLEINMRRCVKSVIIPLCQIVKVVAIKDQNMKF